MILHGLRKEIHDDAGKLEEKLGKKLEKLEKNVGKLEKPNLRKCKSQKRMGKGRKPPAPELTGKAEFSCAR